MGLKVKVDKRSVEEEINKELENKNNQKKIT